MSDMRLKQAATHLRVRQPQTCSVSDLPTAVKYSSLWTPMAGLLLVLMLLQLLGCGGSGNSSLTTRHTGAATFTIRWPNRTKSTRLVPAASNVVRIVISTAVNGGGTVLGSQDAVRGSGTLTYPPSTVTFKDLAPGNYYATATAYSGYTVGTTVALPAQANASLPITIADNQTTQSNLTMGTTITSLSGVPSSPVSLFRSTTTPYSLNVTAKDASNATVLTSALIASVSDTSIATVSGSGPFSISSTGQAGTVTVTVSETEANISQSFTLTFHREIYVADTGNNRIVRMDDMNGTGWTAFGTSGSGVGQFNAPTSVALDTTTGKIYVADTGNNRIVRMNDMNGSGWTTYNASATGTSFAAPKGVTYATNKIWVADTGNNRVCSFTDMIGTGFTVYDGTANSTTLTAPESLYVVNSGTNTGRILIADTGAKRIIQIDDISGSSYKFYDGSQSSPTLTLGRVTGITEDNGAKLYFADVTDVTTNRLVNINTISPAVTTTYPVSGNGTLYGPYGLAYEHQVTTGTDHIYITDSGNNRIVSLGDITGATFVSYGTSGSGNGNFNNPTGIFVR